MLPIAMSVFTCCVGYGTRHTSREILTWQRRRNKEIERDLKKEKDRLRRRQMILLLGTGESGKSTFLKQMKIINGKRFSSQELAQLKDVIYDNIFKGVLFLLETKQRLGIPWASGENSLAVDAGQQLRDYFQEMKAIRKERARLMQLLWEEDGFLELVPAMRAVWADAGIREAFDNRHKVITENFSENARYYLNRLNYIGVKNYCPTDDDIVWSRKPTESIIEEEIYMYNAPLVFIDVGGQTKERRKWCQCFSGMTSVLFLIACSHYDEHYQDRVTKEFRNKLREAMIVFEGLINHIAFRKVSIIIFFNKTDILKEKVAAGQSSIRDEFPNFPSRADPFKLQDVQSFMVEAFASLVTRQPGDQVPPPPASQHMSPATGRNSHSGFSFGNSNTGRTKPLARRVSAPASGNYALVSGPNTNPPTVARRRMLYRHFTTAVDRRNMETVFHAMQDTVLQNNMRRLLMS